MASQNQTFSVRKSPRLKRGFGLIEVMIAGGMMAIMAAGSMHVWVSSTRVAEELILRQKAVFVLNAEMERFMTTAKYSMLAHSGLQYSAGYPSLTYRGAGEWPTFNWERFVYPPSVHTYAGLGNNEFVTADVNVFDHESDHLVLFVDGGLSFDRNYVWIDRDRNVAGRFGYWLKFIMPSVCQFASCYCPDNDGGNAGDACAIVEIVLDYPYRLDTSNNMIEGAPLQTLTLRTIFGRQDTNVDITLSCVEVLGVEVCS